MERDDTVGRGQGSGGESPEAPWATDEAPSGVVVPLGPLPVVVAVLPVVVAGVAAGRWGRAPWPAGAGRPGGRGGRGGAAPGGAPGAGGPPGPRRRGGGPRRRRRGRPSQGRPRPRGPRRPGRPGRRCRPPLRLTRRRRCRAAWPESPAARRQG